MDKYPPSPIFNYVDYTPPTQHVHTIPYFTPPTHSLTSVSSGTIAILPILEQCRSETGISIDEWSSGMKFLPNQDFFEVPRIFCGTGDTHGIKFCQLPCAIMSVT